MNPSVIDLPCTPRATKAVVLTRVSSKEQEEGYSIAAQRHRLEHYCIRKNLEVIAAFEITESSTSGDRKKFMDMVRFVEMQKEPVALVADKVDRVQRSFKEYPLLDGLVQRGRLELHFNTENQIIHQGSTSHERMMWSMAVMMAQSYIDSMRDNVKRSIEHKIRLGELCAAAPIGYKNIRDENGKSDVVLDPARAPLVRKLFVEYSAGDKTMSDLVLLCRDWDLTNARGKKSHPKKTQIHAMLNNPFYYGMMRIKGQLYPHRYERLIAKDLFDKCQTVLKGWKKKPFQWQSKEYIFRGLITCAATGRTVTADTKTKTNKKGTVLSWTYLRCWNPDNPEKKLWIREEKVLAQVEAVFEQIRVPDDLAADITAYLKAINNTEREFQRRQVRTLRREYDSVQNKIDGLIELLLDQAITRPEFEHKKARLNARFIQIENQLAQNKTGDDGFKTALVSLIDLMSRAHDLFKNSTVAQKRALVNFMFANLSLNGPTLCYELKKPFDLFINTPKRSQWRALLDVLRTTSDLRAQVIQMAECAKTVLGQDID